MTKRVRTDLKEHIRDIEARLLRLTQLFRHLHPDLDLDLLLQHDDPVLLNADSTTLSKFLAKPPSDDTSPEIKPNEEFLSALVRTPVDPVVAVEDPEVSEVSDNFSKLSMTATERALFFGKSSSVGLLYDVAELQRELNGSPWRSAPMFHKRSEFWSPSWLESARRLVADVHPDGVPKLYEFPDDDLMPTLIDNFFEQYNTFYPILHRPTFETSVKDNLHLTQRAFGGIVLLVCAIGSRHCNDPRVLLDGVDDSNQSHGWRYFSQISFVCNTVLFTPTLYDLQTYCLALEFILGTTESHSSWLLIGIAIRLAQEVGVHRFQRKTNTPPTIEDELWKRAFWTLVCEDRLVSSMLGRTCAIGGDDLDLDLPTALDDEYIQVEADATVASPTRPSLVESFNLSIRLIHILGTALRTITPEYCSNKSKVALGLLGEWQQPIVAQLDSSLNQWLESLPEHLRWDSNRNDSPFFRQSAYLHVQFSYVQIVIHRPFLRTSSSLATTSMAICANAARRCIHVVDVCSRVAPSLNLPLASAASFVSGIVLLLNLLTAKRAGQPTTHEKDLADIRKCMDQQKMFEEW
ncbi:hypothetical protein ONZ45_g19013 [Pleurotus djamor]|nr:hypothetical protein ONZ45_g19013 [Pleurotus djamor]